MIIILLFLLLPLLFSFIFLSPKLFYRYYHCACYHFIVTIIIIVATSIHIKITIICTHYSYCYDELDLKWQTVNIDLQQSNHSCYNLYLPFTTHVSSTLAYLRLAPRLVQKPQEVPVCNLHVLIAYYTLTAPF